MQFQLPESLLDYIKATGNLEKDTVGCNWPLVGLLQEIDDHWRGEVLRGELAVEAFAAFLLGQSYFLWLATVRSALSGHGAAVFPMLRASLESACYGYTLAHDPGATRCWLDRDKSQADLKAFRRRFGQAVSDAAKLIAVEHEVIAQRVRDLYDSAITFGAHPNPHFLLAHVDVAEHTKDRARYVLTCLNAADSENTRLALSATVEAGLMVCTVNALSFDDHPRGPSVVAGFHAIKNKMDQVFSRMSLARS